MNNILDELLPQQHDQAQVHVVENTLRYEQIKKVRVHGKIAILLPDGKLIARALDRRIGQPVWVPAGRRAVS